MGSLVSVLAKELKVWPEIGGEFTCDPDGEIRHSSATSLDFYPEESIDEEDRADDYGEMDATVITEAQWQAERDKLIQSQANEVEMKGPFPCAPAGDPLNTIEYDIEFPSGVFSLEAKTDQIDGPIKWRDTILHCQAIIEDCEREIERNVDLLDREGLMMQIDSKKAMQHYELLPFEQWKDGDIVKCVKTGESVAALTIGKEYTISFAGGSNGVVDDEEDHMTYCVECGELEFIRRP